MPGSGQLVSESRLISVADFSEDSSESLPGEESVVPCGERIKKSAVIDSYTMAKKGIKKKREKTGD